MQKCINAIEQAYKERPSLFFALITTTFLLVYFHNLGLMPLLADEATRSVVAMEMMFSKNYIVTTICSDYYYRKPPFYNWIMTLFFRGFGNFSEFTTRFPAVLSLFVYGYFIYRWCKQHLGVEAAFLTAAMFVTCGRMLIYDSFLGHIDIFYSLLTFASFIVLHKAERTNNKLLFFTLPFLLNALAFLCKGLPSAIFIVASAGVLLLINKKLKWLFSWQIILGALLFLGPIAAYFYAYGTYNSIEGWYVELWDQSAQRTVVDKPWYESIVNLATFWTDQIMHLAPWCLLFPALFTKRFWSLIKANPFLRNMGAIFAINIIPYWLSPGYYPRYLFMLYPILFAFVAHFYYSWYKDSKGGKVSLGIFGGLLSLMAIAPFAIYFTTFRVEYTLLKVIILVILLTSATLFFFKTKQSKLIFVLFALAFVRLGFNWFVMPNRVSEGTLGRNKTEVVVVAKLSVNQPLFVHKSTDLNHYVYHYTEAIRGEILSHSDTFEKGNLYYIYAITLPQFLQEDQYEILGTFHIQYEDRLVHLIKIK